MKRHIIVLLCICLFPGNWLSHSAEDVSDKIPEEKKDNAELIKALDDADSVVVAEVKNVVNGKIRNYAALAVSEELKGTQYGKILYVGFDPATQNELFQAGKKGLWMLKSTEEATHLIPVDGKFFDENADTKQIAEILAGQNSSFPDDIEFTISSDKTVYAIDEPIRIEMKVRNKGAKSVTFDNAILWRFTHNYSLTLEKDSGAEILKIEKPEGGIVGEFAGPRFMRISAGETKIKSFNLIRLIAENPPSGTSLEPRLPKCKASLAITWNTKNLKEYFPDIKSAYAIEGIWTSPEIKFEVTANEAEFPEGAVKEVEKRSGIDNLLDKMSSDDQMTFVQAEDAFVEYAVPALEPALRLMIKSNNPIIREAAGRSFLWLAKHPKLMNSDALLEYLAKSEEITDAGAYNQVLSFIASVAIRQGRKEYVSPFISVLESENVTIIVKKEVVAALSAITGLELSEENFDETIGKVNKWLKNPEEKKQATDGTENTEKKEKED